MLNRQAVFHQVQSSSSYSVSARAARLRLRTARGNCQSVQMLYGDKFAAEAFRTTELVLEHSTQLFEYWVAEVEVTDRRLAYYFRLTSGGVTTDFLETGFSEARIPPEKAWKGFFQLPFLHENEVHRVPSWVPGTVFYQIFVDRFFRDPESPLSPRGKTLDPWGDPPRSDSLMGGNLRGITKKLDYLAELGIGALYLTPVFQAVSNHKYDTTDYLAIDSDFGTEEDLRQLVSEAHKKGIRVLLDAVFNHSGPEFAPFREVRERGERSKYKDWFHLRHFPLNYDEQVRRSQEGDWSSWFVGPEGEDYRSYETFGYVPTMPKLNTAHPPVQEYLLRVARYWIEKTGIDGWRLDVADEVDHGFWREFRKTVRGANAEAFIVGEIGQNAASWLQGDQHDGVMNYNLTWLCDQFFARSELSFEAFRDGVTELLVRHTDPVNSVMMNMLESHDTSRFMTRCGTHQGRHLVALSFLLAYPGSPMLYYGQEAALEGGADPDNRRCMPWESENRSDFRHEVAFLLHLRNRLPVLRHGDFRWIDAQAALVAFERRLGSHTVRVLLNPTDQPVAWVSPAESPRWIDLFDHDLVTSGGVLGPWSALWLLNDNSNVSQ